MTKKDYEMVAKVLAGFSIMYPIDKDTLVHRMSVAFKNQNERFDEAKFKAATDQFQI